MKLIPPTLFWCLMTMTVGVNPVRADEPTGASLAWTSDDPRVVAARELLLRGELLKADQLLVTDETPAVVEMREIVRRTRREYGQDEGALLAKLRKEIPDVTADDLRRWRESGQVQHRIIDGEIRYFRREPSNIFRFCDDAKARRVQKPDDAAKWKLTDHLAKVVAEAERTGKTEVVPVKHRITFTATVPAGAGGMKPGSIIRAWLPFPQEYRQQKGAKLVSSEPAPTRVADNGVPHRALYYEVKVEDATKPVVIKNVFDYTSYAYYPILNDERAKPLAASHGMDEYLSERLPHIAFTPELRGRVKEVVGDETNPLARARKIFHWVDANVRYCAEEEYGVIPSFSTKALTSLKGDCGIQGNLFITMCRAAGVPARWQSGWETKPVNWNMHDWAEFYVEPWGWLPADPSYGVQKSSDDPKVRDFYFGHQDSYRLIVNMDFGRALVPRKQSLRSEPADFQRGEVEVDGRNLYFDEWDYEFSFEQTDG